MYTRPQPFIFFDFLFEEVILACFCFLMFIDIMLFILNTWFYWLKTFNQNPEIFFEGIFCHETCGHGQAICLWDYCSCRFRTPSAKYPLLLCFTATDCVEGKKSKTTRAWRRSGSRTTLLSTLFSNDWLGPGPVWPFYYFDAIFLLLQGSRIGWNGQMKQNAKS